MLRKRDSQYKQLKICLPPICLYCHNIIFLQGLLIDSRNDLFLEYSCGCKQKKSIILFDKYYYQPYNTIMIISDYTIVYLLDEFDIESNVPSILKNT